MESVLLKMAYLMLGVSTNVQAFVQVCIDNNALSPYQPNYHVRMYIPFSVLVVQMPFGSLIAALKCSKVTSVQSSHTKRHTQAGVILSQPSKLIFTVLSVQNALVVDQQGSLQYARLCNTKAQ